MRDIRNDMHIKMNEFFDSENETFNRMNNFLNTEIILTTE